MEKEALPKIKFSEFELKLNLKESSPFLKGSFSGAVVRGSVMFRAKKLLCANRESFDCSKCMLAQKCPYAQLFETKRPKNSEIMKKYNEIPHPFVITPLIKNNSMIIKIVLFGEYIEYFPYFFLIFKSLEKDKEFSVIDIKNFGHSILKNGNIENNFIEKGFNEIIESAPTGNINIAFVTPLRIKNNGKYVNPTNFRFEYLIRNLLRRISLLSYFYGEKWEPDFNYLIDISKKVNIESSSLGWLELERYSLKQKAYMAMGGLVGDITFSKEANIFYPFLKIGEYTRIGKNTSFGHGYYKIK